MNSNHGFKKSQYSEVIKLTKVICLLSTHGGHGIILVAVEDSFGVVYETGDRPGSSYSANIYPAKRGLVSAWHDPALRRPSCSHEAIEGVQGVQADEP